MIWDRTWLVAAAWCGLVFSSSATFATQTSGAARGLTAPVGLRSGSSQPAGRRVFAGGSRSASLLQVKEAQTSELAHSLSVAPDFFEEASLESDGFDPKATNDANVIAGLQTTAVTAGVQSAAVSAAVASGGAAVYEATSAPDEHSMRLMDGATPAPPQFAIVRLHEAASRAQEVFSLFGAGARAAFRNAAPSLFSASGDDAHTSAVSAAAAKSPAALGSAGKVQAKPSAIGLAETAANASAIVSTASGTAVGTNLGDSKTQVPIVLGAMNFFSGALTVADGQRANEVKPIAHPSMMSVGVQKASSAVGAVESASAFQFHKQEEMTAEKQQQWLEQKQKDDALAAEALQQQREAGLEDSMDSIRQRR